MNILITNDDGWGFEGIEALESIGGLFGNVWVVAPEQPMSGISHQMTFERPMRFVEKSPQSYSLDGTPADCVRVAMTQLNVHFDWVFSGINKGANLGSDVNVSGTVAAAREASLFGAKGVAFSQHLRAFQQPFDWPRAAGMSKRVIEHLLAKPPETASWVNVNFPDVPSGHESVEIVETQLDRNPLPTDYEKLDDGRLLYRSVYNERTRTPGCDVATCFSGSISVTTHDS
jgi:5'-nucleotidase